MALGAPAAADGGAASPIDLRPLLVVLGLLLSATVIFAVSGFRDDRQVTVVASPSPAAQATTRSTGEPIRPTPTAFEPHAPDVYTVAEWGITLKRDVTTPWQAVEVGFDGSHVGINLVGDPTRYVFMVPDSQTSRDLFFGACSSRGCARPLISLSLGRKNAGLVVGTTSCWNAPDSFVFDCLGSNDLWPVTVSGSTLAELEQDWLATVGGATVKQFTLDGEPAIALDNGGLTTVLAVHGKVLVALITQPLVGSGAEDAARALEGVIENFRFDDMPAALSTSSR